MEGVTSLPPFLGILCKDCCKPFIVWKTEYEGIKPDDPDFDSYLEDGCTVVVVERSVVGDIKKWCGCKN